MTTAPHSTATGDASAAAEATFGRITRRIIPFLILCYVFNFLDRVNIGIARLQFNRDLGFDDTVYGIGTGIFFVSWVLCEVPSNLMLERVGFRKTLLRIMTAWGLVSVGMMFVTTSTQFYVARLLLGAAEAGFIPGIFLYLTYWYPSSRRARMTSLFYLALPISGLVGNPLSGWIMETFAGVYGLKGWQWLFLLEGAPTVLLGVVAWFYLDDGPGQARWLSDEERRIVANALAAEEHRKTAPAAHGLAAVLRDPRLYLLGIVSFSSYCLANTISYWSPAVIQASGVSSVFRVGLAAGVPFAVAAVAMILVSRHSDRTLERRWHAAIGLLVASAALAALPSYSGNTAVSVLLLAVATAGHYSTLSVFWTIPSAYLPKAVTAPGIAVVSTIGAIGAAISPMVLGWTRTVTGELATGLYLTAAVLLVGSVTLILGMPARLLPARRPHASSPVETAPLASGPVPGRAEG